MRVAFFLLPGLVLACTGTISEPSGEPLDFNPSDEVDEAELPPFQPAPPVLPRLTARQYRNALHDVFGPVLPDTPVEADTNPHLFTSIGAATTTLSEAGAEQYEEAAHAVADAIFATRSVQRDRLLGCSPRMPGDDCIGEYVGRLGRRLFRRPLTREEQTRWVYLTIREAEGDPWRGLSLAVAGLLQSPNFLYRVELGHPDPDRPGWRRFDDWEMASRLSFLLWGSIPDEELLDAAGSGQLSTPEGLRVQAERLLDDERARETIQAFFAEYLDLRRLEGVSRETYPHWSPTMAASMRREVELIVDDVVFGRDADVRELFSTRTSFVNAELAALYGMSAPGASATEFVRAELPAERAGLLGLGAFLAMNAHPTETSPTLRGKYVRERVLCQSVPAPPDDVNLDLTNPDGAPPATLRERLDEHRTNPACASCHAFIDPPGFLFEHFDSSGAYRTHEPGGPVNASGDLDGVPLDGARDLAEMLRDDPRVGRCLVRQLYRHANGRLEAPSEARALRALEDELEGSGHRFRSLLLALVTSDAFRSTHDGEEE